MVLNAIHIEQPYSGEYIEKIYDIKSCWNSSEWSWIKFEEEKSNWCGEFRGRYRGVGISKKLEIVVVLTSDYMYVLDIETLEVIDFLTQPQYVELTVTPKDDILLTDGYGIWIFRDKGISDIECIEIPVCPDDLHFKEYTQNLLTITCNEFLNWGKEMELFLDYSTFDWEIGTKENITSTEKCKYYEWDEPTFVLPDEFYLEENSDLAEALNVFWSAGGLDFFNVVDSKYYSSNWLDFMGNLYFKIESGEFVKKDKSYPVPISNEQKGELTRRGVPAVFITDL